MTSFKKKKTKHISKRNKLKRKTKKIIKKNKHKGGFFDEKLTSKVIAISENHRESHIEVSEIIEKCKKIKNKKFYIFTEMELKTNIYEDDNCIIIP